MYFKKTDIIEKIFYITITIYFLFAGMTITMITDNGIVELFAKLMRYACYALFLLIIMCNIINLKERITFQSIINDAMQYLKKHLLLLFLIINTLFILISTGEREPFVLLMLIWACSFYDFNKIVRVYFNTMIGFMLGTWGLSVLGLIPEIMIYRGDRQRFSIGFVYPLETMTFFLFLVICYIYVKNKDFGLKDFTLVNVIALLLYVATDARTSYYLVIAVSIVALLFSKTSFENILKKISWKLYCLIPIACAGLSIFGGLFYDPQSGIWQKLDSLVSGRLKLTNNAFHTYGFTLFGQKIEWVGFGGITDASLVASTYNFVDCAYAKMLLDYGIVFSIIVILGYVCIYRHAVKKDDYLLVVVVSVVLVVSIMEPRLISIEMNPFLLLLGTLFLKTNKANFKFI